MNCPVCGAPPPHEPVEKWLDPVDKVPYAVLRCPACGVEFSDPFANPGPGWYARFSTAAGYEDSPKRQFLEVLKGRDGRGLASLDIGCGNGFFVEMASAAGFEAHGIDINPTAVEAARARGLEHIFQGDLASFKKSFPEARFDLITYFDCLEHLDSPNAELAAILSLLREGGVLALTTPNTERPLPFGRDYFDMPPHHLTRWTPAALRAFLERNGLEVLRLDSSWLPVWEFSRHFADAARELVMKAARALLLRGAPDSETFTSAAAAGRPAGPAPLRSARTRQRLVRFFHGAMHVLSYPVFFWMALYYRLARPGRGVQLFAVARRRAHP